MSRDQRGPNIVVEWSPTAVSAYDPIAKRRLTAGSLAELAPNLSSNEAVFAVSRRSCFVRTVRIPDVSKEDAMQALGLTIAQHVPVDGEDASFDISLTQDVGPQGRTAVLTAMSSQALRSLYSQAQAAGIKVLNVMPAALGSGLIAHDKGIQACAVVSDSVEGLAMDIVAGGDVRYTRVAAPGLSATGLEAELNRTFAAAQLPCAPTLAAGLALKDVAYSTNESPLEALAKNWGRIGISIQLPEVVRAKIKSAKANRARLAALLCVSAVLLGTLVYLDRSDQEAMLQSKQAESSNAMRKMRNSASAVTADLQKKEKLQTTLNQAFQPAQRLSEIVTAVNNAVPERVWLTGISVERGNEVLIRGTALTSEDVASYQANLSKSDRFRSVKLLFANNGRIEQTPVVQFSISAFPLGNVPMFERTTGRAASR
jgi:Tfp pilus assembly protein PilN